MLGHRLLLPFLAALVAAPAFASGCATEAEALATSDTSLARFPGKSAAAQVALGRLEALRKSTFEVPSYSGDYGYASFLAEQSRRAKDERLRDLLMRAARDQFIRHAGMDLALRKGWAASMDSDVAGALVPRLDAEGCRVDAENLAWLKADIKLHGWPRKSVAGENADSAAWLIVQHAVTDLAFMREVLALLEPLVTQGETAKSNYALLYDRVAYYDGRPQRYGSQGTCTAPHRWSPSPIENAADVDKRRAEIGQPPMAEYIAEGSKSCP